MIVACESSIQRNRVVVTGAAAAIRTGPPGCARAGERADNKVIDSRTSSCGRVSRLMRMADLRGNVSVIIESSKASFPRRGHSLPSIEPPPDALVSRQSVSFFGVSEHTAEESGNLGSAVGRGVDLERFSDALHAPG